MKKAFKTLMAFISVVILALMFGVPAFAYTEKEVSIPVIVYESSNLCIEKSDGTVVQTCRVDNNTSLKFTVSEPGTYEYVVKEATTVSGKDAAKQDATWYVAIGVYDVDGELDTAVAISKIKTGEKSKEIKIGPSPKEPDKKTDDVDTGDKDIRDWVIVFAFASAGALLLMVAGFKQLLNK